MRRDCAGARWTVAFQGERGAFGEEAAHRLLGRRIRPLACETFAEAFRAASSGRAQACLVPIENTLAGSIHENYDLMLANRLRIQAEIDLRVVHCLIAPPGATPAGIRRVYSHPAALAQCSGFFEQNPLIRKIPFYDTAGAVKMLLERKPLNASGKACGLSRGIKRMPPPDAAAIAGSAAAKAYGGRILRTHLEDHPNNYTRFLLLTKSKAAVPGANKTSVVFSTRNEPGSLFKALSVFALRDMDLTKIESRPLRGRVWEYHFYLDFLGNIREERCRKALDHLAEITDFLRVLGCYRSARD